MSVEPDLVPTTVMPPPLPPPLPVGAAVAARFCTRCGGPLETPGAPCASCQRVVLAPMVVASDAPAGGSVKSALALYFALLAVCMIGLIAGMTDEGHEHTVNVEIGTTIGISAVVLGWALVSWRIVLPLLGRLGSPRWWVAAVGVSLVTFGIAAGVITGLQHFMQLPGERLADGFLQAGYGWGVLVLVVAVQPAIFEELAFRGVIIGALEQSLSPFETVMVSALMFMILHLSVGRFPHTLALGLAAGFLRVRTRSLYPCILLHFSHNFMCVAAEWAGMKV